MNMRRFVSQSALMYPIGPIVPSAGGYMLAFCDI